MLGFHPFSTQAFSSAIPFLDVQTTTNLISAAMSSATTVAQAEPPSSNLALTVASTIPTMVSFITPSGVALAAAINDVAPFTWTAVSDTTSETWSQVSDSSSQSWTQVDDTTDQEWSDL
jgi:hypothetical protein